MTDYEYIVRELRFGCRHEAGLLADMWNRSEGGWPGGWTGGVAVTADEVMSREMRYRCHSRWVVECAGEIVGYVNLLADEAQPRLCYVGLLNARTDHHGRGVGRRLLRRAVRQAIDDRFERVELHTWSGNLKAVPLYKKCGFFWSPDTCVHMQNYIPTILHMPLLADLFREHDWYAIQHRELTQQEDLERWHGVRVYRYHFRSDGQWAQVIVDRQAQMPTAAETDELLVAAWVGREELPALREHSLHYEFVNKTDRPMAVTILAQGEVDVPIAVEESFRLKARKRLRVPFRLSPDLARKRPGEPPHRVLSTVTIDGVPVRLGTALAMRQPVEIEYAGEGVPVGKWRTVNVRLRNRLPFPASGRLWIGSPAEIERSAEQLAFRVKRDGWANASFKVRAMEPQAHRLEMRLDFSDETAGRLARGKTRALPPRGKAHAAWLRAYGPGRLVLSEDQEHRQVVVESDRIRAVFHRAGGGLEVKDGCSARRLFWLEPSELGPPFGRPWFAKKLYDAAVHCADGAVHLTTRADDDRFPGLTLERELVLGERVIEVRHRLLNASDAQQEAQVLLIAYGGYHHSEKGCLTVPSPHGLIRHERRGSGAWPLRRELRSRADAWSETWMASERDGVVTGMVWQGTGEVVPGAAGVGVFAFDAATVPAGRTAELPALYFVAGPGDYRTVRTVWATYVHSAPLLTPEEREPPICQVLRAELGQSPTFLTLRRRRLTLSLTSEMGRPLDGEARLVLPGQVRFSNGTRKTSLRVRGLAKDAPLRRNVTVEPAVGHPTAAVGELALATGSRTHRFPMPFVVVRASKDSLKLRHGGDTVSVDTGVLRFTVSAEHNGSLVSLKHRGRELLHSSYPEPRPYWWMNRFYGGIEAGAGQAWDARTQHVERRIGPTELRGTDGVRWEGAEVKAAYTHPDLRWLSSRTRYLSTAGSNLIAVEIVVSARPAASQGVHATMAVWPRSDAGLAWAECDGQPCPHGQDPYEFSVEELEWAAIECGRRSVLAVVPRREAGWRVGFRNVHEGSFTAGCERWESFTPPRCSTALLTWVAVCRSVDEAYAYRFLAQLRGLP